MIKFAAIALAGAFVASSAFAQATQSPGGQGSSNAQGVQIQGNTNIKASAENQSAIAKGEGNTAKNATGAIKGGTQIKGNTNIQASSKNSTAAAIGKNNTATNDVGTIGGK